MEAEPSWVFLRPDDFFGESWPSASSYSLRFMMEIFFLEEFSVSTFRLYSVISFF